MIGFSQFWNQVQDPAPIGDHGRSLRLMARAIAAGAVFISAIGIIPAGAQTAAPTSAPKPVIQAKLAASPLPGVAGSYCWPQPGQSPCALVEDPKPTTFAPANVGDVITFNLNPAGDTLASLMAYFLDDTQADGKALQIDLTASQGAYTVDQTLSNGPHRIEVDAAYPALADGSQNYVAYVFGIQIGSPSPTAGTTAAAVATTAVAAVPTGSVPVVATGAATSAATSIAVPSATNTLSPTATDTPTDVPTNTPSDTPSNTPSPTATITPTDIPTDTPTSTMTFTWTPSPTNTATLTPSVTPTSTGIALGNGLNVPKLALVFGAKSYDPVAVTASIQDDSGAFITVTRPINANSPFVQASGGTVVQLQFSGPKPVSELGSLQTGDATVLISQQVIQPGIVALYALPTKAGLYTLSIAVQWAQGSATYIYHVQISG